MKAQTEQLERIPCLMWVAGFCSQYFLAPAMRCLINEVAANQG